MRNATIAVVLAVAALAQTAAAAPVPVVLAVDTSRSLSHPELSAAVAALRALVAQLPPGTPVGVIEFADRPRWLARPAADRQPALDGLGDLEPTGRFTLLNDALFETARTLSGGGVIVLASDGRDENSATTPDDVARICAANGVRVVTLGVGRRIDERALRRLALLTDGGHVGPQPFAAASNLAAAVDDARRGVAKRLQRAQPTPVPTAKPAAPPRPTAAPAEEGVSVPAWITALLALGAIAVAVSVLMWRRQQREERRVCPRCGLPLEPWDSECPQCRAEVERSESEIREREDRESLARAVAAAPHDDVADEIDPALLARTPLDEAIDKTFVLGEVVALVVKEARKPQRAYQLGPDAPFTVGRAPKVNTVSIADPTMSAQHFRIVCKDGSYYVADLETTNGTTVNGERIRVHKLQPGDRIRAGEVEFEFRVQLAKRS